MRFRFKIALATLAVFVAVGCGQNGAQSPIDASEPAQRPEPEPTPVHCDRLASGVKVLSGLQLEATAKGFVILADAMGPQALNCADSKLRIRCEQNRCEIN